MLNSTQEYNALMETIRKYVDGANGDLDTLREAYHQDAIINARPIVNLFNSVERNGKTNASSRLDYLDFNGHAASAKVIIEDWHGYAYVEYLHLLKTDGTWKIVSKVFDAYRG